MPRKKTHKSRMYQLVGEPGAGARFVGYARYSSDMQDGGTIETQNRRALAMGADQKQWTHVGWYIEPAHSAKYEEIEKRPVFAQLLADAGVKFDAVLCFMSNRWSRNVAVTHLSLSQLRKKGVWWATTNEPFDIDKIMEAGFSLAHGLTAQLDHDYVVQLSKRTIEGKEDRARTATTTGRCPSATCGPTTPPRRPERPRPGSRRA
jgi:DNA invertase Pin-like site-specific DNA recombinase